MAGNAKKGPSPADYRRAGAWLQTLYRDMREQPLAGFRRWALQHLRELLDFDAAMWASASNDPPAMHEVCLLDQSKEMLQSYLQRQEQDFFRTAVCARPGHTVNLADLIDSERLAERSIYRDHGRRFGLRHLLGTAEIDPATRLIHTIVLSRADPGSPFTERDRQLKEFLAPHLFLMARNNCLMHVGRQRQAASPAHYAATSEDGLLQYIEPGFLDLLREEWPDWQGPALPAPLTRLHAKESDLHHAGRRIHFQLTRSTPYLMLQARRCVPADRLSPREREVAEAYARGHSYKQIARHLGIAPSTVRNHLYTVYGKLRVRDKTQLAAALARLTA